MREVEDCERRCLNIEIERTDSQILDFLKLINFVVERETFAKRFSVGGGFFVCIDPVSFFDPSDKNVGDFFKLQEQREYELLDENDQVVEKESVVEFLTQIEENEFLYELLPELMPEEKTNFEIEIVEVNKDIQEEWKASYLRFLVRLFRYDSMFVAKDFQTAIMPNFATSFPRSLTMKQLQLCFSDLPEVYLVSSAAEFADTKAAAKAKFRTSRAVRGLFDGKEDFAFILAQEDIKDPRVEYKRCLRILEYLMSGQDEIDAALKTVSLYFKLQGMLSVLRHRIEALQEEEKIASFESILSVLRKRIESLENE